LAAPPRAKCSLRLIQVKNADSRLASRAGADPPPPAVCALPAHCRCARTLHYLSFIIFLILSHPTPPFLISPPSISYLITPLHFLFHHPPPFDLHFDNRHLTPQGLARQQPADTFATSRRSRCAPPHVSLTSKCPLMALTLPSIHTFAALFFPSHHQLLVDPPDPRILTPSLRSPANTVRVGGWRRASGNHRPPQFGRGASASDPSRV
jgi:hypothetical protein